MKPIGDRCERAWRRPERRSWSYRQIRSRTSQAMPLNYTIRVERNCWRFPVAPPEREALQALVTETQRDVTGVVRLKLYKGNIIVAGRRSQKSLYEPKIATMEGHGSAYDQSDATGFIRLNALRLKLRATLKDRG